MQTNKRLRSELYTRELRLVLLRNRIARLAHRVVQLQQGFNVIDNYRDLLVEIVTLNDIAQRPVEEVEQQPEPPQPGAFRPNAFAYRAVQNEAFQLDPPLPQAAPGLVLQDAWYLQPNAGIGRQR